MGTVHTASNGFNTALIIEGVEGWSAPADQVPPTFLPYLKADSLGFLFFGECQAQGSLQVHFGHNGREAGIDGADSFALTLPATAVATEVWA